MSTPSEFVKPELAPHGEPPAKKGPKVTVAADDQLAKWKQIYDGADDKIKEWTEKKKLAREQLVAAAQTAIAAQPSEIQKQAHDNGTELVHDGKKLGTVTVKKTKRLNTSALKEKEPEIYEKFAYETETVEFRAAK